MPVQPYVYTEPPVVEPYLHGLLGAATEITPTAADDPHWRYGGIEFESLAAYPVSTYAGGMNTTAGSGGTKVLSACLGSSKASAFTVYGGVVAGSVGHNDNGSAYWTDRARRIVELSAQHAVELALWTGSGGGAPALNAATTPLIISGQANTTTGAVDLLNGLSVAEQYLADHYAGRGIIHAPRGLAPYLQALRQVQRDPDNDHVLTTALGTKYAFGGGYDGTGPGAVAAPAAASGVRYFWLYATGQVEYLRSAIDIPATFGQALDRAGNQVALLAEQEWLVAVDAVQAAVLIKSQTLA